MKNPDLLTIGSIIISVALLAMATVLLLYGIITFTNGGLYFLGLVAAINGFTGALKAPSAQQATDLVNALAASGPVNPGPLVQIHTTPVETQVSSAALPAQAPRQVPQPIVLGPQPVQGDPHMLTQIDEGFMSVPPGQGTFTSMQPPQGTAVQAGAWQIAPPASGQAPYQVDRNWTGLVPTVPPGQPPQQ